LPHFHAVHPDFELQIEIQTMTIRRGKAPAPAHKAVIDWAKINLAAIKTEWNRINPRYPVE
jgi:Domain of unknown function (DUF4160)